MTITRLPLSASTAGLPVNVAATATPGTTIHQPIASVTDEIYVFLFNKTSADITATIEYGVSGAPNDYEVVIPAKGVVPTLVIPGLMLNDDGKAIRIFAPTGISAVGYINRIT